jgi:hypothetical protein
MVMMMEAIHTSEISVYFNGQQSTTSQKAVTFILTAVKT